MSSSTPSPPAARRVLVVEDDPTINQALTDRLVAEGFDVVRAWDGPGAVEEHDRSAPHVVLLDRMLPGFDGLEVCRRIQAARPVPVLMLTALGDESDVVIGLGVGADDYLAKPFRMREVVARVHALLRRADRSRSAAGAGEGGAATGPRRLGGLEVDPATRRVLVDAAPVHLTPTEFDLLLLLAAEPGTVCRRETLVAELWGWDPALVGRTLDSHVKALRAKIGAHRIRTVHGVGYALEAGPA